MSITSRLSENPDKIFKKQFHRRNDSGELDVFEAARYFSGYDEVSYNGRRGGRMSLDLPIRTNVVPLPPPYTAEKQMMKEKKQCRQPSSPGGRLASFLNSLFRQSVTKKKKKPKNSTPVKTEDEIPPRRRRSSLSTLIDSKSSSIYSSSSSSSSISGFRTPPAAVQTPIKNYREIRSYLDQKQRPVSKNQVESHNCDAQGIRKMDVVDEGAESDSSSDLFELRIYDLDCYSSSGLPVYETTNFQNIKRASAPVPQ